MKHISVCVYPKNSMHGMGGKILMPIDAIIICRWTNTSNPRSKRAINHALKHIKLSNISMIRLLCCWDWWKLIIQLSQNNRNRSNWNYRN